MRNIQKNPAWAFGCSLLGVPIAAAMSLSSVSVITDALRRRTLKL